MSIKKVSRVELLNEFESAPNSALFNQHTLAAILDCSTQLLERNRWAGDGVPYIKIGRKVLYRKSDILQWLAKHLPFQSTTQHEQKEVNYAS